MHPLSLTPETGPKGLPLILALMNESVDLLEHAQGVTAQHHGANHVTYQALDLLASNGNAA